MNNLFKFKGEFSHYLEYVGKLDHIKSVDIVYDNGTLSHLTIRVYLKNGRCIIISFMCMYYGFSGTTSLCMMANCNEYNKMLTKDDTKMSDNEILAYINKHIVQIVYHISHKEVQ